MRSTIVGMTSLTEQLPYVYAFPDALGTGLLVHTESVLDDEIRDRIGSFIHEYEVVLSRFRDDSIVGRMRTAAHGGTFDFPDWASGLFGLYDRLFAATDGATDPCVGEDLIRLGYDESYSFTPAPDAAEHAGAIHGRAIWSADVERHGTTLVTRGPVALDFGACGKGYLVDLLAGMLGDGAGHPQPIQYVIDAGGDLLVHTDEPITIALEDPADPANAVGTVEISHGAFCASSPSRRHWSDAAGHQLHHLLNAIDGLPVDDVAATWVAVTPPSSAITTKTSTHGSNASTTANRDTDDSSNTVAAHVPVTLADGLATRPVHHPGHPAARSLPLRMRHSQRQPHRRPIPQFSRRLFHTLMYEIISITSLGWTDGLLPSVSYADGSPRRGEPSIANPLIR